MIKDLVVEDERILALVESGLETFRVRRESIKQTEKQKDDDRRQEVKKIWDKFETAVCAQLPAILHPYVQISRSSEEPWFGNGGYGVGLALGTQFGPIWAMFQKARDGYQLSGYEVGAFYLDTLYQNQSNLMTKVICSHERSRQFKPEQLELALAMAAVAGKDLAAWNEEIRQEDEPRQAYKAAWVAYQAERAAVMAANDELVVAWQEKLGTRYPYSEVTYAQLARNEDGIYRYQDVARVLENQTDRDGFWRVIFHTGRVQRIEFFHPVSVSGEQWESLPAGKVEGNLPYWDRLTFPEANLPLFLAPGLGDFELEATSQRVQADLRPLPAEPDYRAFGLESGDAWTLRTQLAED